MSLKSILVLNKIYKEIYRKDVDYTINIFLCGASTAKKTSLRQSIYEELKSDPRTNVVFPEFLFSSKNYRGKFNLLKLEDLLAANVDLIILPLEGMGTICELGAFAVNDNLRSKIIVLNSISNRKFKSFINVGPIELIEKENKRNVIWYDERKLQEGLDILVDRVKYWRKSSHSLDLNNIFNLSRFIQYVIAIYQPITLNQLRDICKKFKIDKIDISFIDSAIQILTTRERIVLTIDDKTMEENFSLSEYGHKYIYEDLLKTLHVVKEFTKIRNEVLAENMKKSKFKPVKVLKLLEL